MLRPRAWWEGKFAAHGAIVNRELLWAMQEKDTGCGQILPELQEGRRRMHQRFHNLTATPDAMHGSKARRCRVPESKPCNGVADNPAWQEPTACGSPACWHDALRCGAAKRFKRDAH